jgi:hypothetical protein
MDTKSLTEAVTSTGSGSAILSTGSTGAIAAGGVGTAGAAGGVKTGLPFSTDAATDGTYTVSSSSYSYGSYNGSYDLFGSTMDADGFVGGSPSSYQVSASVAAAIAQQFELSQDLPPAIGDINSGRVSPIDTITVVEDSGPRLNSVVITGTASQILSDWINVEYYLDDQSDANDGDLTILASLLIPGGAGLEMNLAQMDNYLTRSATSLYNGDVNQAVGNFFMNELGRSASSTDYSDWASVLFDTGSDLNLRTTLAFSVEAQDRLNGSFENTLNRSIDAGNLAAAQEGLLAGYFTQSSWLSYLAYVPEAADDLGTSFQNVLNRPIDAGNLSSAQAGLASGYLTQASWLNYLAYLPEAADDLGTSFQNVLNRPIDAGNLSSA